MSLTCQLACNKITPLVLFGTDINLRFGLSVSGTVVTVEYENAEPLELSEPNAESVEAVRQLLKKYKIQTKNAEPRLWLVTHYG